MGWIDGTLAISCERTFYLSLDMSSGLGKGGNANPFQRQLPENERRLPKSSDPTSQRAHAMNVYDTLKSLNIELPPVAVPAAAYVPFVQTGKLVFLSGHIAKKEGKVWAGQLGKNMDTAEGQQAARAVAIDLMGTLHAAVGDLNNVKRIVKVMSLVNSTGDFTEQHLVTNGCSELLGQVFGPQAGAHARSAFGVAQIPMGACVEIELIAELH
jgi:enamine deaminase RidA (YjgF/YER057c/UK114 family)